jgi:hypothetical protein
VTVTDTSLKHDVKVAVFIPTYDRIELLKRSVESVLSQGVPLRLHILDNGSPDGASHWPRDIKATDSRVKLVFCNLTPATWAGMVLQRDPSRSLVPVDRVKAKSYFRDWYLRVIRRRRHGLKNQRGV